MAGEIQLNSTTALTEDTGAITLNNVNSATNRTNLGLGSIATQASDNVTITGGNISNATLAGSVQMESSGLTVRNITQVVLTSDQSLSNSATLTTFFSPTYTPLFTGSKVLGVLTLVYITTYPSGADGRKDFQIEYTGTGITDTVQMNGLVDNFGLYDYNTGGIQNAGVTDISSKLLLTTTTDVITANCKIANAQAASGSEWIVRGSSTNLETFFTWIEFK